MTNLDRHDELVAPIDHRAHAERALDAIDDSDDPRNLPAGLDGIGRALLAIHGTLAEIRDRLPERTEVKVAPFDPDLVAANIAALKHELETPMREHGECCEPAPADDLPGEPVEVEPEKTHPCPGCGTFTGKRVCNSCWGTSDDPEAGYSQAECIEAEPGPADDLPGEPVEPGDLRAGNRVAFTYDGERIACILVSEQDGALLRSDTPNSRGFFPSVVSRGDAWIYVVTDVRLIERAPREDEDPNEALGALIWDRIWGTSWRSASEVNRAAYRDLALKVRERIEAEWKPYILREQAAREKAQDRAAKAETALADERDRHDATITERDALRERLLRLRADLSPGGLIWPVDAALRRDDERAAKGEQR